MVKRLICVACTGKPARMTKTSDFLSMGIHEQKRLYAILFSTPYSLIRRRCCFRYPNKQASGFLTQRVQIVALSIANIEPILLAA